MIMAPQQDSDTRRAHPRRRAGNVEMF